MKGECATWNMENRLGRQTGLTIAGVDEVGRGAWAGNMVCAAAAYSPDVEIPFELRDSKQYSPEDRERLVKLLTKDFINKGLLQIVYAEVTPVVIEVNNLNDLNIKLFKEALDKLPHVDKVIIDGTLKEDSYSGFAAPGADAASITVATASIFAKVHRDGQMKALDLQHPGYGFADHVGYGTKAHVLALQKLGPLPGIHRNNFLRNLREKGTIPA